MSSDDAQNGKIHDAETALLERQRVREQIRRLLAQHQRPVEIMDKLGLSKTTFYRHLRRIKKEDQVYIAKLRGEEFASSVRQTIEALQQISADLAKIAESAPKQSDRVAAMELRYQVEIDLLNVQKLGPSSVPITHFETARKYDPTVDDREDEEEKFGP